MRSGDSSGPRRPRVLMLCENQPVPPDRRVLSEARTLRDQGFAVSVICQRGPGQPRREDREGIRIFRYAAPPPAAGLIGYGWEYGYSLLRMGLLSLRVLLGPGFDVIHAANPPDLLFLVAWPYRLFGKRFIYDQHDLSPELYLSKLERPRENGVLRVLRMLERASYRRADAVIVTNDSYRGIALQRGRVPEDRVFVVRNGPPEGWPPAVPADPDLKRGRRYLALYVGVMGPQDGVDFVLRAAAHVLARGRRDVLFALVGNGDALVALRGLARELGVEDAVEFTGWVDDDERLAEYLATADVCLSPEPASPLNDRSTFIKVMEYMAARRPIVAFDLPETRISAGEAALYARPDDAASFGDAIVTVLGDAELRSRMRRAAEARLPELRWEAQAPVLVRAYARASSARDETAEPAALGEGDPG